MTNKMTTKDLRAWALAWAAINDEDCDAYRVAAAVLALLKETDHLQKQSYVLLDEDEDEDVTANT